MKASIARFFRALLWDFKVQYRYYFFLIAIVVSAMWLGIFRWFSIDFATFMPIVIFADILNIGFLLVAGIFILERRQGTIFATAVTPVSPKLWLTLKLVSLTILCTMCAAVIIGFAGEAVNWFRIIPAVMLSAALFVLLGLLVVLPFDNLLNYFFAMALLMAPLNLPIFEFLEFFSSEVMWLLPSQAAMQAIAGSINDTSLSQFSVAIVVLSFWVGVLYYFSVRAMNRFVSTRHQQ
jgi:fluoroquinolone transport system permease protein